MGVNALADVRELLRVAEQDDASRRLRARHRVGERHLAGLVDEERVDRVLELVVRPEPRRAGGHVVLVAAQAVGDLVVRLAALDQVVPVAVVGFIRALDDANVAGLQHRLDEVADHLVRVRRDPDLLPGANQLVNHACAGVRLATAWRTLNSQRGAVQRRGQPQRAI